MLPDATHHVGISICEKSKPIVATIANIANIALTDPSGSHNVVGGAIVGVSSVTVIPAWWSGAAAR